MDRSAPAVQGEEGERGRGGEGEKGERGRRGEGEKREGGREYGVHSTECGVPSTEYRVRSRERNLPSPPAWTAKNEVNKFG